MLFFNFILYYKLRYVQLTTVYVFLYYSYYYNIYCVILCALLYYLYYFKYKLCYVVKCKEQVCY